MYTHSRTDAHTQFFFWRETKEGDKVIIGVKRSVLDQYTHTNHNTREMRRRSGVRYAQACKSKT